MGRRTWMSTLVTDAPPVDCFYAYPTVDVVANPVLQIGSTPPDPRPEDVAVTLSQVGRFAPQCRLFVPLYRQIAYTSILTTPLTGLKTGVMDVEQAWDSYWEHDNIDPATRRRRGVVVLGHSQGTIVADQLIQDRFDGNPETTAQLVSAVLLGGNVQVPIGAPSGGGNDPASTFQHVPACERASTTAPVPTGCVVAYSSFNEAEGQAPGPTIFGRNDAPGHKILCSNPAALLDGVPATEAKPVDAYFPNAGLLHGDSRNPTGSLGLVLLGFTPETGPTGFTHYQGPGTIRCASSGNAQFTISWLQVSGADSYVTSPRYSPFGTHVADFSITAGDLARLITAQTRRWQSAR